MIRVAELPSAAGAYVLVIDTGKPIRVQIMGRTARLLPGGYFYCGSARGPGGIRARVGRHLKKGKTLRWHIDRLTAAAEIRNVIVAPGGTECALFELLFALPGAEVPIPGFGSSDCRRCRSHLLRVSNATTIVNALPLEDGNYLV